MRIVVMDTKHHRTVELPCAGFKLIQPLELSLEDQESFKRYEFEDVVFTLTGESLYGDAIYYQTEGPTLPVWWWGCKDNGK